MTGLVSGDISRWAMRVIMARVGKPKERLICCPERSLLSNISMAKAITKDKRNEPKRAAVSVFWGVGLTGSLGTGARDSRDDVTPCPAKAAVSVFNRDTRER